MTSSDSANDDNVIFWALNDYGVKIYDIIFFSIGIIVSVIIIVLNFIVLDTMIRRKWQMEPLHVMIASLALADLSNGVILIYNMLYNIINFQNYTECLFRFGLVNGIVVTSVLHLVGQTFDRFMKIIYPFFYIGHFTVKHAVIASVIIWVFSLIFASLPALGWSNERQVSHSQSQSTNVTNSKEPLCSYFGLMDRSYIQFLITLFVVPFSVMAGVYIFLFRIARKHARSIAAQESTTANDVTKKGGDKYTWKYTKTVVIIVGLYFTSWAPCGAILLIVTSGYLTTWTVVEQGSLLFYATSLAFINSIVNPLVYAVKISAVRLRFRQVFSCGRHKDMVFDLASTHQ